MVSRKRALFAVFLASTASSIISNQLWEARRRSMINAYEAEIQKTLKKSFSSGWDDSRNYWQHERTKLQAEIERLTNQIHSR